MKSGPNLWIVDSFTDKPFHGNPADVHQSADLPPVTRVQVIANELNLSEKLLIRGQAIVFMEGKLREELNK